MGPDIDGTESAQSFSSVSMQKSGKDESSDDKSDDKNGGKGNSGNGSGQDNDSKDSASNDDHKSKDDDSNEGGKGKKCSQADLKNHKGRWKCNPTDFDSVYVTITEVSAHSKEFGWIVLNTSRQTVDLVELATNASSILGNGQIPVGHYTQMRLKIDGNATGVEAGKQTSIKVPSGAKSGLKLKGQFEIKVGKITELTLNFDPLKSIKRKGNGSYVLVPVIKILGVVESDDDVNPPLIAITSPSVELSNLARQNVVVEYSDQSINLPSFKVFVDGVDVTSQFSVNDESASASLLLAEGLHEFRASIADEAGNVGDATPVRITIDTTGPILSNIQPNGLSTVYLSSNQLPVQGESNEPLSSVTVAGQSVQVSSDGLSYFGAISIGASGSFTISTIATDRAGNPSQVDFVVPIVIDQTPPLLFVNAAPISVTNDPQYPIQVQVSDQSPTVTRIFQNGNLVFESNNTAFNYVAQLTEGINAFMVVSSDMVGLAAVPVNLPAVVLDVRGPILSITSPTPNQDISGNQVSVVGSANEPLSSLTVNGQGVTLGTDPSTFSNTISLQNVGQTQLNFVARDLLGNESSTTLQVNIIAAPPEAILTLGSPSSGEAPLMVVIDGLKSTGVAPVTYELDFGDGTPIDTTGYVVHEYANPGNYIITLTVRDAQNLSDSASVSVTAVAPPVTPDPVTVAPPPPPSTTIGSLASSVSYLYSGTNPIQTGVAPNAIDNQRIAVVSGTVFNVNGTPIAGARVSIPANPALGETRTGTDGKFRMAVNGGGDIVVHLSKNGFLPIQRRINTGFQDFFVIPQIQMVDTDPVVTEVSMNLNAPQIVRGSEQVDSLGARKSTVIIPSDVQATLTFPSAPPVHATKLSLRATELTTGSAPELKFKAALPPGKSALYMVDITADEGIALGADHVVFSKLVPVYVENVRGLPTGMSLEYAIYDDKTSTWIPKPSGRVIKVLDVQNGVASVDLFGNGGPATAIELQNQGISSEELQKLASLYQAGQSLLRVETDRFSTGVVAASSAPGTGTISITIGDSGSGGSIGVGAGSGGRSCYCFGICFGCDSRKRTIPLPAPATPYTPEPVALDINPARDYNPNAKLCGSVIDPQSKTLGERVPIAGTNIDLVYSTDRQLGRAANRTLNIPITYDETNTSLSGIIVDITVAGKTYRTPFGNTNCVNPGVLCYRDSASPMQAKNQQLTFTWDGLNDLGQIVKSAQTALVRMQYQFGYRYVGYINVSSQQTINQPTFGLLNPGVSTTTVAASDGKFVDRYNRVVLGTQSAEEEMSGWLLSNHHFYDSKTQTLYLGSGTKRRPSQSQVNVITSVAGKGVPGNSLLASQPNPLLFFGKPVAPSPTQAAYLPINQPSNLLVGENGTVYFSENGSSRIMAILPDGTLDVFAGTGVAGFSGDGGQARNAQLNSGGGAMAIAFGPDGSMYISDRGNHRIRRVRKGIIETIAGTGTAGCSVVSNTGYFVGKGPFPIQAPENLVFVGDVLYFTDSACHAVYAGSMGAASVLSSATVIAGNPGTPGYAGDNGAAINSLLNSPNGITANSLGELFVGDSENNVVRKIDLFGNITTYVGNGQRGAQGDGGLAMEASLNRPTQLAFSADGVLYIADTGNFKLRKVSPMLQITTLAGNGSPPSASNPMGDGALASQASFNAIAGIAIAHDGSLLVSDRSYNVIRKISPFFNGLTDSTYTFGSDNGSEIFIFGTNGLHQKTLLALTGATKWEFGYDGANRLTSMTDGDGNLTTISRNSSGQPTSITSPFGHVTTLAQDANGRLASITNPNNETYTLGYNPDGLLAHFTRPSGKSSTFHYDSLGNLTRDEDAAGGFTTLAAILSNYRLTTQISSAEGRSSSVIHSLDANGDDVVEHTDRAGQKARTVNVSLSSIYEEPSGSSYAVGSIADPLLGLPATLPGDTIVKHGGVQSVASFRRNVTPSTTSNPFEYSSVDTVTTNGTTATRNFSGSTKSFVVFTQGGKFATRTIDSQGRTTSSQVGSFTPFNFIYDPKGRLSSVSQGARSTGFAYDSASNIASITDGLGQITSYEYDPIGRLTKTTFHDGRFINFAYDSDGNLVSVSPPGRPAHTFSFSLANLMAGYFAPALPGLGNSTLYSYNRDRQLTSFTKPSGEVISFGYDSGARLSSISTNQGTASFAYGGPGGNLSSSTSIEGVQKNFGYSAGLVNSVNVQFTPPNASGVGYTEAYSFDANFNVVQKQRTGSSNVPYPTFTVSYGYDADRLLNQVGAMQISRDPSSGLVTGSSIGTVTDSYSYDLFGEIVSYQAGSLYSYSLVRDSLGRVTQKTETIEGVTTVYDYTYNSSGWLTQVKENGAVARTYTYDSNGNRTSVASNFDYQFGNRVSSVTNTTLTYNSQDQILSAGAINYVHNANGEMTNRTDATGNVTSIAYSPFGKVKTVNFIAPNGSRTYFGQQYDADQELVSSSRGSVSSTGVPSTELPQRVFAYSYSRVSARIPMSVGAGTITPGGSFEYGSKSNVPDLFYDDQVTLRIISDHLGSPRLIVSAHDGVVRDRIDYDEFGRILNLPRFIQPFGFAGGVLFQKPTTNIRASQQQLLVSFGARVYDPEIGRWLSRDPIAFGGDQSNLYLYVNNDPVNFIDPNGLLLNGLIDAGESYGEYATSYWAKRSEDPCASSLERGIATAAGLFSALWTQETSDQTALTLVSAYGLRNAGRPWQLRDGSPARTVVDYGGAFRIEKHVIGKGAERASKWHVDAIWGQVRHWPWGR